MKIFVVSYGIPDWAYDHSWVISDNPGAIRAFCYKENAERFIAEMIENIKKTGDSKQYADTIYDRNNYEIKEVELVE